MTYLHCFFVSIRTFLLLSAIQLFLNIPSAAAFSVNKMAPYCLNVKMALRPDQRDTFLTLIKEDQRASLATEPACLQFVVGEDTTTSNTFYLHEEYKNEAGFKTHTETPHFAKWDQFCKTQPWSTDGGPLVDFYHGTHEAQKWKTPEYAFCLNVSLYPKAEMREEFLKVIAANKEGTDGTENLALQYVYGESTETANAFHFHEQYTGKEDGKEGFDGHAASAHFADWEAFTQRGDPFGTPPVVSFFKTL